jgi:hypothetical protein
MSKQLIIDQKKQISIISETCNSLFDSKYQSIHDRSYLIPNQTLGISKEHVTLVIETLFIDKSIDQAISKHMKELGTLR